MMKRILLILLIGLLSSTAMLAQKSAGQKFQPKQKFTDRLFFGGYIGAQFGSVIYVDVSPQVGYRINHWLQAGVGFTYMYYEDRRYPGYEYNSSSYGPRLFAKAIIWEGLFAYTEYEALNVEYWDVGGRGWLNNVFIGGGYQQSIGGKAFASVTILFNVNDSYYSPYQNPVIRIGFGVGL